MKNKKLEKNIPGPAHQEDGRVADRCWLPFSGDN
jgi:hypothetical protein